MREYGVVFVSRRGRDLEGHGQYRGMIKFKNVNELTLKEEIYLRDKLKEMYMEENVERYKFDSVCLFNIVGEFVDFSGLRYRYDLLKDECF